MAQKPRRQRRIAQIPRHVEPKFDAAVYANFTPSTSSVRHLINGMTEGTSVGDRIGSRVRNRKIDVSFRCHSTSAAATCHRFIIVQDTQNNGQSAPTFTDLDLFLTASTGSQLTITLFNPLNSRRFRVLRDVKFVLSGNENSNQGKLYTTSVRLNNTTRYNFGNSGTSTDIIDNAFWLIFISDPVSVTAWIATTTHTYTDS
jgi:hypothetical protein